MIVSGNGQLRSQLFFIEGFSLFEKERVGSQKGRRCDTQQGGGCRNDENIATSVVYFVEGRQPLGNEILMRGKGIVWQGFPVGKKMAA